jgi:hypothetical protein
VGSFFTATIETAAKIDNRMAGWFTKAEKPASVLELAYGTMVGIPARFQPLTHQCYHHLWALLALPLLLKKYLTTLFTTFHLPSRIDRWKAEFQATRKRGVEAERPALIAEIALTQQGDDKDGDDRRRFGERIRLYDHQIIHT